MRSRHYKALITRPESQGRILSETLAKSGFESHCFPLFNYQPLAPRSDYDDALSVTPSFVIFVSVAAVEYANETLPLHQWSQCPVIAVGKATQQKLLSYGLSEVICPLVNTSEGLLKLDELACPKHKHIIIVRGNGGRELIANTLKKHGAIVRYIESYQRQWIEQPENICHQWQQLSVNCMVITSNEILQSVVQLLKDKNTFWRTTCVWVVASERIANTAAKLGLQHIVCSYGASDKAILDTLLNMERTHDREKNTRNGSN